MDGRSSPVALRIEWNRSFHGMGMPARQSIREFQFAVPLPNILVLDYKRMRECIAGRPRLCDYARLSLPRGY